MPETQTKLWENRIVGSGTENPDQLLANPRNWRIHPQFQREALASVLDRVGWVQNVIVNQRTGHVVDGHLRVSLALSRDEQSVPVVYVDLSEEEEELVLLSIDPLSALAVTDKQKLEELINGFRDDNHGMKAFLDDLSRRNKLEAPPPPESFGEYDETVPTEHRCPKCGYAWSGKPG